MDWLATDREDELAYLMCDPMDLSVRGELHGVLRSGAKISSGYYTDTRESGSISFSDSDYIENSLVRIVHRVPAWGYEQPLGTFFVTSDETVWSYGRWSGDMELHSMLYAFNDDLWTYHFSVDGGAYCKDVLKRIFEITGRPYRILDSVRDTRISSTTVYKIGDSILSTIFDVCAICGARLETDALGYCVVEPYVTPSNLTPIRSFSDLDPMVIGAIKRTGNGNTSAGRSIVLFGNGDSEVSASADVGSASRANSRRRGRMVAVLHSLTSMDPQTGQRAQELASQYLSDDSADSIEYSATTRYFPCHEGDAVELEIYGQRNLCLVKSVDTDLQTMTMNHTWKVV